jgi:hypothetical protein
LDQALGFTAQKVTRSDQMRVAKILARLGYAKAQFMRDGRNTKGWKRVDE